MRLKHTLVAVGMAAALFLPAGPAHAANPSWSVTGLGGYSQFSDRTFYPVAAESLADEIGRASCRERV